MKICIIGAGIAGLSAAYNLSKIGHEVSIYESSPFAGGQASTIKINDFEIEKAYHHLFVTDKAILDLYKELGMSKDLKWYKSSVATYSEGKVWKTTSPFDLLLLSLIPFKERIKLILLSLRLKLLRNWKKIENVTAYDWLSEKVNKKTFEIIFRPLLYGKFGEFYKTIGMPWFWSKIQTRVSSRNYKFQEILCYPNGSFSKLINKLEEEINSNNGNIYFEHKITKIITKDNSVESVDIIDNKSIKKNEKFDIVISTAPYKVLDKLIDLEKNIKDSMCKVDYMSAIVMILNLKNSLSDYYWLSIAENNFPFLGIIEHTNLIPKENYGNNNILYITNYVENDNNFLKLNYKELIDIYTPYLKKINYKFTKDWILDYRFNKINFAQPIIPINYSSYKIPLKLPIKGLYSGNTAQIYPEDRGTNYAVDLANKITKLIKEGYYD